MIRNCPLPAALTVIPAFNCGIQFDQIVKIAFQRRQDGDPSFDETDLITAKASWDPLLAAVGATKVVVSPVFTGFTIPASEPLVQGGNDNSTFNGIPEYNGEGSVTPAGQFKNVPVNVLNAMDSLSQESLASSVGKSNLTAFFITKDGMIIHNNGKGFPIYNFRVGTTGSEGFNAKNIAPFSFSLDPYWDRTAVVSDPAFDPLTELV